ncbi:hypothetical protein ANO14919_099600 [Xylariales sp. No.14919]|nr:hypothetical protein ANO14919_099600 [Xylariales sp. No.14919]
MLITACLQVAFLAASGIWAGFGRGYMAVSCGFTMVSLIYMLQSMDLDDPAECAWFFKSSQWFVNLGTAGGLILEYLMIV